MFFHNYTVREVVKYSTWLTCIVATLISPESFAGTLDTGLCDDGGCPKPHGLGGFIDALPGFIFALWVFGLWFSSSRKDRSYRLWFSIVFGGLGVVLVDSTRIFSIILACCLFISVILVWLFREDSASKVNADEDNSLKTKNKALPVNSSLTCPDDSPSAENNASPLPPGHAQEIWFPDESNIAPEAGGTKMNIQGANSTRNNLDSAPACKQVNPASVSPFSQETWFLDENDDPESAIVTEEAINNFGEDIVGNLVLIAQDEINRFYYGSSSIDLTGKHFYQDMVEMGMVDQMQRITRSVIANQKELPNGQNRADSYGDELLRLMNRIALQIYARWSAWSIAARLQNRQTGV